MKFTLNKYFWTQLYLNVLSTSTWESSCLLDGEPSQGRGSDEQEMALINLIAISK